MAGNEQKPSKMMTRGQFLETEEQLQLAFVHMHLQKIVAYFVVCVACRVVMVVAVVVSYFVYFVALAQTQM